MKKVEFLLLILLLSIILASCGPVNTSTQFSGDVRQLVLSPNEIPEPGFEITRQESGNVKDEGEIAHQAVAYKRSGPDGEEFINLIIFVFNSTQNAKNSYEKNYSSLGLGSEEVDIPKVGDISSMGTIYYKDQGGIVGYQMKFRRGNVFSYLAWQGKNVNALDLRNLAELVDTKIISAEK